jgi:hypothetical protein
MIISKMDKSGKDFPSLLESVMHMKLILKKKDGLKDRPFFLIIIYWIMPNLFFADSIA